MNDLKTLYGSKNHSFKSRKKFILRSEFVYVLTKQKQFRRRVTQQLISATIIIITNNLNNREL